MGTSSGLIHHYFDSMDDVLAAAFEQAAGGDLARARAAIAAEADPARSARRVHPHRTRRRSPTGRCSSGSTPGPRPPRRPALQSVSRRLNRDWQALVRGIIERGVAGGKFVSDEPEAAAWRLLSVLDGLALQVVAHDVLITRDDVVAWTRNAAHLELGVVVAPR